MKRLIFSLLLLPLCGGIWAQKYNPITISNQLSANYGKDSTIVKVTMDFPARDASSAKLDNAVRKWLHEKLASACEDSLRLDYKGDLQDGNALIRHYQKKFIDNSLKELVELAKLREDTAFHTNYFVTFKAKTVYETEKLVTYRLDIDQYMGGAHGLTTLTYATFRKIDGHILTWGDVLRPASRPSFSRLLAKGVVRYFAQYDKSVKTFAQAKKSLFLPEGTTMSNFPFPATNPGLTAKGVEAVYQSYEIGPYAIGRPSVTIPLSTILPLSRPLFRVSAKAWE